MYIKTFNFVGHDLPVVTIDGDIWIHLASSCSILEMSNPSVVVERHVSPRYSKQIAVGVGMPAWFVTESGFYQLVFNSKSEKALEFQIWVFEEVLPSIREQGIFVEESRFSVEEKAKLEAIVSERDSRIQTLEAESIAIKTAYDNEVENNHVFDSEVDIWREKAKQLEYQVNNLTKELDKIKKGSIENNVKEQTEKRTFDRYDQVKLKISNEERLEYLEFLIDDFRSKPLAPNYNYNTIEVRKMVNSYFLMQEILLLSNEQTPKDVLVEKLTSIVKFKHR